MKSIFTSLLKVITNVFSTINNTWLNFLEHNIIKKLFVIFPNNLCMFLLMIVSFVLISNLYQSTELVKIHNSTNILDANSGEIYQETISFQLESIEETSIEYIDNIGMYFGTYERENDGEYTLNLIVEEKIEQTFSFNASELKDIESYFFEVEPIAVESLNDYTIELIPEDVDLGDGVALLKENDSGTYAYVYANNRDGFNFRLLFLAIMSLIYFGFNYLVNSKKIAPHNFLLYCVVYLLCGMILTPPFQVPDEPFHFYRNASMSEYKVGESIKDMYNQGHIETLPDMSCVNYSEINGKDFVSDKNDIINCLASSDATDQYAGRTEQAFLGAIIPSVGIRVMNYFSDSPLLIFYSGRLMHLLVSVFILYKAIKMTPKYKASMLVVALMPMSVFLIGSYSYDSILISISIFFVAKFLHLKESKLRLKWSDYLIFLVMAIYFFNVKIVYLPIALLLLFLPKECFGTNKYKCIKLFLYFSTLILLSSTVNFVASIGEIASVPSPVDPGGSNLEYILGNPLYIFRLAYETITTLLPFYIQSLVGSFGWLKFHIDEIFILAYITMFIYLVVAEKSSLSAKEKVIFFIVNLFMISGVFAAMYFSWSDYQSPIIVGVQGRYFIPILVPFIVCLPNVMGKIQMNYSYIYSFINVILLYYVMFIFFIYY